jgi:hypothetical protein
VNAEHYTRSRLTVKKLAGMGEDGLAGGENGATPALAWAEIGQTTDGARGLTAR